MDAGPSALPQQVSTVEALAERLERTMTGMHLFRLVCEVYPLMSVR